MRSLTTQTKRLVGITLMLASVLLSVANPTPLAAMSSADVPAGDSSGSARLSQPDQTTQARVFQEYGKLPLHFEANQGQTDSQVKFLLRGNGYTLFLTPTETVLTLRNAERTANGRARPKRNDEFKNPHSSFIAHHSSFNTGTVLRMKLVGANPQPHVAGLEELPGKVNSFIGNDPKKWRTNIPTYAKVKYEDVYPGVAVIYYGNQRQLEHDFVVTAGVDPKVVTLEFEGADKLEVNSQGNLILHTVGGETLLQKPMVYQDVDGVRKEISGGYVLRGKHHVGFDVGMYDTTRPVVIDPVLVYSTYLGGGGTDQSVSIAVDSSANAYVTGFTFSTNFPTTPGAFQTTLGGADAFVTKLNATGTALVYSTYLGGSGGEEGFSLTVDSSGNAYVTGGTSSVNFPTTPGAFQTTFHGGGVDAFVTKLNATGSALVYSTYLGANGGDEAFGIALDSARNAYVTGETNSITFPTTPGAFQTLSPGSFFRNDDAFVTKINSTGTALIYSTYLGGSRADDGGRGIIVDPSGNAYVTGFTFSTNFPTKGAGFSLAFQRTLGGGADTFVTKVNATGSALVYSTYLGGGGNDESFGIALDSARNAYVTGFTFSTNFPTTPGAFQTTLGGGADAFVTKLNFLGSALFYSTYLGGNQDENFIFGFSQEGSITVDSSGNAYVTGDTTSLNFPTTRAVQTTLGGSLDAFVTKLSFSGDALIFSTFLGGSVGDVGIGIALDSSNENDVYVTGRTFSGNFPTTPGAFQTTFSGGFGDAFVTKIDTSLFIPGLTGFWQDLNQSCGGSEGHVKCLLKGTFVVQNPGTATASNSVLRFVLSEDATFDESDTLLQEVAVGALKAGETKTRQLNVALPDGRSASGQFVIAVVDADNDVPEANEANNIVVSPPIP